MKTKIGDWLVWKKGIVAFCAVYITIIALFAVIYFSLEGLSIDTKLSKWNYFLNCLYFSVVTITTLGYGDISPSTPGSKTLASFEAIIGIVLIGFILNELWRLHTDRQVLAIKKMERGRSNKRLLSYFGYLEIVIEWFLVSVCELTTPVTNSDKTTVVDEDFPFSQMQYIFNPSLLVVNIPKTALEIYQRRMNDLIDAFRFCLSNYDVSEHPTIHDDIIEFMKVTTIYATFDLLATASRNEEMKKMIIKYAQENEKRPDPKTATSLFAPIVGLYDCLQSQIKFSKNIKNYFLCFQNEFKKD